MNAPPKISPLVSRTGDEGRSGESLVDLLRFERLVSELSARFISLPAAQIDAAIEDSLRRIVETLGIDRSTLLRSAPDTGHFQTTHSWAASGLSRVPTTVTSRSFPWALAMVRAGKPVIFSRLDELPPEAGEDRRSYEEMGLRSNVALPLLVAGQPVAVLAFGTMRREREWPEELVARLQVVGEIFANALARKRAQEDLDYALGFERLLTDISTSLLRAPSGDLESAIATSMHAIGEFLGVERVALWSLGMRSERFELTQSWVADGVAAPPAIAGQSELPSLFRHLSRGHIVKLANIEDLPAEADVDKRSLREYGTRALLAVPLAVEGVVVGALSLVDLRATRDWPEALVPRVRVIGEAFASVLAHRRAAEQVREAKFETGQYRERLAHLIRVHTMGEMSAAIAHEVNQPLVAIENYALAARRRLASDGDPDTEKIDELLGKISGQAARAGDVLKRLRAMVKRHEYEATRIGLGQLVTEAVRLAEIESGVTEFRISLSIMPGLPPVLVDEIQIQQVILNLIRNAIEAMGDGQGGDKVLKVEVTRFDEHEGIVRIVDSGPGVKPGDEERVFEPFYSTKGTGLGIGLAVCRSIVEAHGGRLVLAPNPGGGAMFEFTLPLADEGI